MTFDIRSLTDDQRSLADDIASAMGFGHEDTCAVWWEDSDGCNCPLLEDVASGLHGARIVEVTQEFGYDPTTQRGDRLERQTFNPHPLTSTDAGSALPTAGLLDDPILFDAISFAIHSDEIHPDCESCAGILTRFRASLASPASEEGEKP